MSTLNPDHVPPFPILQLEYDGETVTLDRIIVEPAPGDAPTEAGVQAVARKAAELGLDAVRVRVSTSDGVHMMAVSADGEAVDATPADPTVARRRRKRILIGTAAAACAVVLAVVGVIIGKGIIDAQQPPPAAAPAPIPGSGEAIPAGVPDGFAAHATWAVPVDDATDPLVLDSGNVLITSPDGGLAILDQDRAKTVWDSTAAPSGTKEIAETTWQGRPVLASMSGRKLSLWALDLPDSHNVPETSIDIGANGEATFAGEAPLIDLGDYTVAVPAPEAGIERVTIPPGTQAVAAGTDVIVSIGDNTIAYTAITDHGKDRKVEFDRPKGTRGAPTETIGITATRALATWESDKDSTTALLDTQSGDVLATLKGGKLSAQDSPQVDHAASTAVVGQYFLDLSPDSAAIVDLELTTAGEITLDGHHVYTTDADGPLDLAVKGKKVTPAQWPALSDDDPPPVGASPAAAYIVTEKVDSSMLYRAPRETKESS